MTISPRQRIVIVVLALTIVVTLLGLSLSRGPGAPAATLSPVSATSQPTATGSTTSATTPTGSSSPTATLSGLAALLAKLAVAPEKRDGYVRTLFRLWIDADGDGCDTRHEVLIQEAVSPPRIGAACSLTGGVWFSPYDGLRFTSASKLDIDHVVPLAEAWDSGAYDWSPDRRMRYANDLDVPWTLIAVSAAANRSKGDQDPADWLPTRASFRCAYTAMWIEVKARWSLTIDEAERNALVGLVAGCPTTNAVLIPAP